MKQIFLITLLLFCNSLIQAQSTRFHTSHHFYVRLDEYLFKNIKNAKSIKILSYNPSKKDTIVKEFEFFKPYLLKSKKIHKNNKPILLCESTFKDSILVSTDVKERKRLEHTDYIQENKLPKSQVSTNKKGKIIEKRTWEFSNEGCLLSHYYYGKNAKLKMVWLHEYYDACQQKKSSIYNGKNKLKKVYSYACKEEGEKVSPQKQEVQICNWKQESKDRIKKISEEFDSKGHIQKTIWEYALPDTQIVSIQEFQDDVLVYEREFDFDFSRLIKLAWYKKGKLHYSELNTFQNGKLVSSVSTRKDKITQTKTFEYKKDDLIIMRKSNAKGKCIWVEEHSQLTNDFK